MHNFLIYRLLPVSIFLQIVSFVVGLGFVGFKTEYYVVGIVESFWWRLGNSLMFRVLLFEFRLVCVVSHVRLITADSEVTSSVSDGLDNTCSASWIFLNIF